jgi:hypothetical protein
LSLGAFFWSKINGNTYVNIKNKRKDGRLAMKEKELKELRDKLRRQLLYSKSKALSRIERYTRDVKFIDEKLEELKKIDDLENKEVKEKRGVFSFWK